MGGSFLRASTIVYALLLSVFWTNSLGYHVEKVRNRRQSDTLNEETDNTTTSQPTYGPTPVEDPPPPPDPSASSFNHGSFSAPPTRRITHPYDKIPTPDPKDEAALLTTTNNLKEKCICKGAELITSKLLRKLQLLDMKLYRVLKKIKKACK